MTRLIDADAFSELVGEPIEVFLSRLDLKLPPTIDAEPVRHGEWLPENRTMDAYWVCSCCGFPSEAHGAFKIYKYCPNCGCRMDAERKAE